MYKMYIPVLSKSTDSDRVVFAYLIRLVVMSIQFWQWASNWALHVWCCNCLGHMMAFVMMIWW